jgi:Protein of unknown function (DUF1684)
MRSSRIDQRSNDAVTVNELDQFRAAKDDFFRRHPQSPLTPGQRAAFTGLAYFPADPALRVEAVLDTDVDRDEPIKLQTTGGGTQEYRRAGRVRFTVDGEEAEITLYQSELQRELFVPFRDASSGRETYDAGRYLEIDPPGPGQPRGGGLQPRLQPVLRLQRRLVLPAAAGGELAARAAARGGAELHRPAGVGKAPRPAYGLYPIRRHGMPPPSSSRAGEGPSGGSTAGRPSTRSGDSYEAPGRSRMAAISTAPHPGG